MPSTRRAVIDIGTNSVKLLVADVSGRSAIPLLEKSEQTRLGSGFYETSRLQPEAIAKTSRAVAEFKNEAAQWNPASIRVIATSAARDALNQADLVRAVHDASGLSVEIVSGEQEADWVFAGVTSDPNLAAAPLLILDVGGGSSEFIVGEGSESTFRQSFQLGTVRLLEMLRLSDPPLEAEWQNCRAWLSDFLARQVGPKLEPALRRCARGPVQLICTGGTATILARMELSLQTFERERLEAVRLSREAVSSQQRRLWSLSLEARQKIIGLPPNRADVILTGAAIFSMVMDSFGFAELRISTRGLRFAAVML
jgi:exopolyphosphatase/guanosine-5'-triphosphate,3'-diphosphate pyrophosphatase